MEELQYLKELVSIKSISSDKLMASESRKAADLIKSRLESLGCEVQIVENEIKENNPILLGRLGNDDNKKTIVFYSHYDVQPAAKDDGWETEPFEFVEKADGYVYARGVSDDKGPIVAAFFAVKSLVDAGELPVNIRFLYEGEEESSSGGFEETVTKHKAFFGKVDGLIILDTGWFGENTPTLDYGTRGIAYTEITVSGPTSDQHSGFGGSIREPLHDLIHLLSKLTTPDREILIPHFHDKVRPLNDEEKKLYEGIEFDLDKFVDNIGADILLSRDSKKLLMDMWRYPSLSYHGIQGAFSGSGGKTVIPAKVSGKVSMRLVPDQDPSEIFSHFKAYVVSEFEKLKSPNKIQVELLGKGDWWFSDFNNFLTNAAKAAIEDYWKKSPMMARSGGSIPVIPFMEKLFEAPAIGIGVGQDSDGAHSQNEHLRVSNLLGAKEVIARTLQKLKS